jgi:FHS family Na+ dependent glucose MFS transporter 1
VAAATVAFPLASVLWVLLLAALIIGLGKSAIDVGGNILLQWVHGTASGPYLNGLHFMFGLGSLLAPILVAQVLARTADIRWAYWTVAILAVPITIWTWLLPEPPIPAHAAAQRDAAPPRLPVLLIVVAFFLYVGAELGFGNWIYTYALTLGLANKITAAYLTSAFWGLFTLSRLLGIGLATRFRPRTILYADFAGAFLSLLLLALAGRSSSTLWLGSIAFGLSIASVFPTMLLLAAEKLHVTGTVTGWFLVGSGAGGLLSWLIGIVFTYADPRLMIPLIAVDLVLNAVVLLAFIRTPRPRSQLQISRE